MPAGGPYSGPVIKGPEIIFAPNFNFGRHYEEQNVILELCKGVHCVDLGESFPNSNEHFLAKFGFNTAENEPRNLKNWLRFDVRDTGAHHSHGSQYFWAVKAKAPRKPKLWDDCILESQMTPGSSLVFVYVCSNSDVERICF